MSNKINHQDIVFDRIRHTKERSINSPAILFRMNPAVEKSGLMMNIIDTQVLFHLYFS